MKKYFFAFIFFITAFASCNNMKIGYLKTENAEYVPNSMEVRTVLDPVKDKIRIENNAPWVTLKMQGILGTNPLMYSLLDVKASEGGDAEIFKKELSVLGCGIMEVPLVPKSPKGKYIISLRVRNDGYSADLRDIFTFIIK